MAYSRGSGKNCTIVNCRNNYKKLSQWKKNICDILSCCKEDCACLLTFRLHSFPKAKRRREGGGGGGGGEKSIFETKSTIIILCQLTAADQRFSSIMYKVEPT